MKKLINKPENFVKETVEGILLAHPESLKMVNNNFRCLVRSDNKKEGKVAIATGGGSGHLPVFLGYVGYGLCDGVTVGNVFASPSAECMYEVDKAIHSGAGVLHLFGNYGGDVMNFAMAKELASMDNINVEEVLVTDDVASAPKGEEHRRRGVAGLFFAYKVAGAAAEKMYNLKEVKTVTEKAINNMRTMGVAISPCTVPEAGKPTFTIEDNEMEIGIHGEPGITRENLKTIDEIVDELLSRILNDMDFKNSEVAILVNGLGATPKEELYLAYRKASEILSNHNIKIYKNYIGEFATSLEMAGMSISLLKLDNELKELIDFNAYTPFFRQGM
ncbi:dihydroxyacetone kinase subunit DhaK [Eubacterium multiforme]|uniref:Dihydroxyacetone kinase-like protein n=1 Tax=Eubacterium multiforme TaxID=83339 RepID=A0ABT9UV17_9FIRM|nr:dihydroxyacetone kinase subunit DhaK [Eubacterium multiforme]MDQ0150131.1 dihydroxyacetone kinase-like protein [Eubacterium multiforme]